MQNVLSFEEQQRLKTMMFWEKKARGLGHRYIAGIDEAGRGPLAGPVVAAACILPEDAIIEGIDDSKKLLPSQRFALFQKILSLQDVYTGLGIIDVVIIDQINILQATFQAMLMAIHNLSQQPDYLLFDGNQKPTTSIPGQAIVRGDSSSQSIAAASIIAKETRDRLMEDYHLKWPQYNFRKNKGYGTKEHFLAIEKHGPCPIHRMSFEPIKGIISRPLTLKNYKVEFESPNIRIS